MPRIGVILHEHDPRTDPPTHFVSSTLATLLCDERRVGQKTGTVLYTAVRVSKKIIWLGVDEPWSMIKDRFRTAKLAVKPIPRILPPRQPEVLLIQYPHPDESSYALRNKRELWGGSREDFARRVGGTL